VAETKNILAYFHANSEIKKKNPTAHVVTVSV